MVLGLQFDTYNGYWISILVGIAFYLFLVLGEYCARHMKINTNRYKRFGLVLVTYPIPKYMLIMFFIIISLLPFLQILSSGQSINDLFASIWMTNTVSATSTGLIEISGQSLTGIEALIKGIQTQLTGFWYLGLGILLIWKRRLFYPVFAIYLIGSLFFSGGFRSLLMASLILPILLYLMSAEKPRPERIARSKQPLPIRPVSIMLICFLLVGFLLALDWLRYGRQGMVSEGTILDRLERTLRTDFAYGGLGLRFGLDNLPDSMDRGISYIERTLVLPIPRVLWPGKPTLNPNQEYTELATGRSFADLGSIILFTPLGEALFNFGYVGIVFIPFFYGFVVVLLERIYSSSKVYKGLLAQVYIWAFLAMRLTFFNLFLTLVVTNFILISILVVGARLIPNRNSLRPRFAQHAQ